ncbi:MAG TPA: hypothetical protein VIF15_21050 [Polyangiaceae bacterium]|jgi:hypothetical protein
MRASFVPVAVALVIAGGACEARDAALPLTIGPVLLVPRGLLQSVARVTVREYFAGPAACDAPSGAVTGAGSPDATTTLSQTGCTGGAVWCGSLQVATSDAERVFGAEADDGNGAAIAVGCAQLVVDQQTQPVAITMKRVVPAAVCGDGVLQPTEQCEPPGGPKDMVCDAACHTREELLSSVDSTLGVPAPGKANPGDRSAPAMVWPGGAAPAGRFVAFWTDKTDPPDTHVALRVLGDDLGALPPNAAPALAAGSVWLTSSSQFPSLPDPNNQQLPAVAFAADARRTFVAFSDDSGGSFDIAMRTLDANYSAEQAAPIGVNGAGGAGEPGVQTHPSIALGTNDVAYVVWQSAPQVGPGQIVGRTFDRTRTPPYGTQVVLSSGSSNQAPVVAALSTGWVVAWQSGSDVVMRAVAPGGQPSGASSVVSAGHHGVQDHPAIAAVGGGDDRMAIAWADHGQNGADIVVQRFDATGAPVGDSSTPVNDLVADGDQVTPALAASANGGFFAVAWLDTPSGHVRARLLDASSGFDFNDVTGQDDEFQVSLVDGHTRGNPVAAVGGSGPFVAIAWEDQTPGAPGIYGRRFPLPP